MPSTPSPPRARSRSSPLPYFLHRGRHLRQDLPQLLAAARQRHPALTLLEAPHLDYDLRLADVITDRLSEQPL